jgi:MtN3 and saliva related transmembrane protein
MPTHAIRLSGLAEEPSMRHTQRVHPVEVLDAAVTAFGIGMGASTLLQARRIVKRRRSDDVSIGMLLVLITGAILWLVYGFVHGLTAVIATNATWLIGGTLTLLATLWYRRAPGASSEHPGPDQERPARRPPDEPPGPSAAAMTPSHHVQPP